MVKKFNWCIIEEFKLLVIYVSSWYFTF